jgi:acetyl-CoA carboxylase carboxyltransferase component
VSALSGASKRALRGGPERHHEKAKEQGKLPVRERVARLLDPGTFAEEALLANWREDGLGADGVVTGLGRIGGRSVALMANDPTVKAGSWGPKTVEKILRIQERALELRTPMVYLVDSAGARITEQVQMFPGRRGAGRIFHNQVKLSGLVPQVCVLFGPSAAGGAYIPAFCDIVIMRDGNASMYLGSPRMAQMVIGEDVTLEEMGGARMHTGVSGCGHVLVKSDEEGIDTAKRYLSYLPGNFEQLPPTLGSGEQAPPSHARGGQLPPSPVTAEQAPPSFDPAGSAANSTSPSSPPNTEGASAIAASALAPASDTPIGELIPADENKPFDMKLLLDALLDAGSFMEIHARWAKELIVGFARLEGRPVGIVANQPKVKGGVLFVDSADKAARFIWTCNAFNVPLLFLADVPGFMIGTQVERQGIIRHGAKMISAVSEATVPKISVVVRKAYGAGLYAMAGPAFDPDCCLALPSASIAVMGPQAAINAVYYNQLQGIADEAERAAETERLRAEYAADIDILHLASELVVDAVIEPDDLRGELIRRFALAAGRRREWPARHNPITPV